MAMRKVNDGLLKLVEFGDLVAAAIYLLKGKLNVAILLVLLALYVHVYVYHRNRG